MADKISSEKRSEIMSKIKGTDTKIEIMVRKYLYKKGFRYRKNCSDILGTPDISIKKYKVAIFVNGCFWHGHEGCKKFKIPKTRTEFWSTKISKNIDRDQKVISRLESEGWNIFVIWECEIESDFDRTMELLVDGLIKIKTQI